MRKALLLALGMFLAPLFAHAQIVPAQNQQIVAPYGGFIVATSTSGTSKLSATSTPYFSNFSASAGTINGNFTVTGTCTGCGTSSGASYPFTPAFNYASLMSATSSPIWARAGLYASSTSIFENPVFQAVGGNLIFFNLFAPTATRTFSFPDASGTFCLTTTCVDTVGNWFTPQANYNSTSTPIGFLQGLFSTASSTFSGPFRLTALTNGFLGVGNGLVYSAASSSLFGFTPANNATTLTMTGTTNQISISGGTQDLSTNRTWTYSFPQSLIFPLSFTSTYGTTTFASSTAQSTNNFLAINATSTSLSLIGGASNCNGTSALTTNSIGVVGCTAQPQGTVTSVTATFPNVSSGGATPNISSLFSTTTTTGMAQGNLYVGSGGIFQTSASSSIFGYLPEQPLTFTTPNIRTGNTINWVGLATTTQPGSSNVLTSNGGAGVYGSATTTVTCTGNATCSTFTTFGSSPFTINVAAGTAASSTLLSDSNTFSGLLNKFSNPIALTSLSGGTLNVGATGLVYNTATSTPAVTAPITYSGTLGQFIGGVSGNFGCTNASAGVTGCLTGTDWSTFNNKIGWGQATSTAANQIVYTNANGLLVSAASSSLNLPNSALTNSSITINTAGGTTGGGTVSLGGTLNLSSFSYPFVGNATGTTLTFGGGLVSVGSTTVNGPLTLSTTTAGCLQTSSVGLVYATTCATGGGSAFPFTPTTNFGALTNATATPIWFQAGLQASTTSEFGTTTAIAGFFGTATSSKQVGGGSEAIGIQQNNTNGTAIFSGVTNDINARWLVQVNGLMGWGAGTTNDQDINLYRSGAGALTIQSATTNSTDAFRVNQANAGTGAAVFTVNTTSAYVATPQILVNGAGGGAKVDVFGNGTTAIRAQTSLASDVAFASFVTGDAQLRFSFLGDGTQKFGSGAATADVQLSRTAAGALGIQGIGTNSTSALNVLTSGGATIFKVDTSGQLASTSKLVISNVPACSGSNALNTDSVGTVTCGATSGGGGAAFPFTPLTNYGVNTSATTTPIWAQAGIFASSTSHFLSADFSSTTASQLLLTDGFVGYASRVAGGNLYISTTTGASYATTTNSSVFAISQSGSASIGIGSLATTSQGTLVLRDQNGTGPMLELGGNSGGDTDWIMRRYANNDSTNNDRLAYVTGSNEILSLLPGGNVGIGTSTPYATLSVNAPAQATPYFVIGSSTSEILNVRPSTKSYPTVGIGTSTPWGILSIAQTAYDYLEPLFTVSTSTGPFGGIFSLFGTSSTLRVADPSQNPESGVRAQIGDTGFFANTGGVDQLNVNGRINTNDWVSIDCPGYTYAAAASISTAVQGVCGIWSSGTDGTVQITTSQVNMPVILSIPLGTINGGVGLFTQKGSASANGIFAASTTPVLEASVRPLKNTALLSSLGTSTAVIGLTSMDPTGSTYEATPASGCYFTASSTEANWKAVCANGGGATTIVDTSISSTSPGYILLRLEWDAVGANFYMRTSTGTMQKVARIINSIPGFTSSGRVLPDIYMSRTTSGVAAALSVNYAHFWMFKDPTETN